MRNAGLAGALALLLFQGAVPTTGAQQAGQSTMDWPMYGNDPGGMHYADVDQINPSNVAQLQPAWMLHLNYGPSLTSSLEVQPVIANGTMYLTSPHDHVYAVDPATGAVKWVYNPDLPPLRDLAICCGHDNRGVAVGQGKVFMYQLDANLVALDQNTGNLVWKIMVDDWHDKWTGTAAPIFVDGKVIVGASGGEFLKRGHISAYDAESGQMLWRFWTVPGPGEVGFDTWEGNSWQSGGATVWTEPVIDRDLGLLIFSTGNAAPDVNGSTRGGNNLFTASVVAIDLNTGQYKWHFQEVHHDLWDYDGPEPPVLFTLERNGQRIPAVHHANKNGYSFILDRRNGQPLFDTPEVPVPSMEPAWQKPSPTQPIPSTEPLIPHEVLNPPPGMQAAPFYATPGEQPLLIQPGYESGPEWGPAAYSPRTHFMYIPAGGYNPWVSKTDQEVLNTLGSTADGSPKFAGNDQFGVYDALDTTTGKIAWQHRTAFKTVGGPAVAGDLVFFGDNDGTFMAADAKTGNILWQWKSDEQNVGGANASPAVYMVGGREYVVMAFGGNFRNRADIGNTNDPPGDAVVAFALPQAGQSSEPNRVMAQVQFIEGRLFPATNSNRVKGVACPPDGAMVVEIQMHDFHYYPDTFTVPAGQMVAVHLVNTDPIAGQGMVVMTPGRPTALMGAVGAGSDTYFVFTAPDQPGDYPFLSDVGNAEKDFGATGMMTVASVEAAGVQARTQTAVGRAAVPAPAQIPGQALSQAAQGQPAPACAAGGNEPGQGGEGAP